jgi:molybdopterin converting factor small subunit
MNPQTSRILTPFFVARSSTLVAFLLLAVTMSGCVVFVHPAHRVRWAEGPETSGTGDRNGGPGTERIGPRPADVRYDSCVVTSIRMLAFAGARDVVGAGEIELPLPSPSTAEALLDDVCRRFPGLVPYRACLRVAVNGRYASPGDPVEAGDEVALIPPVAGG